MGTIAFPHFDFATLVERRIMRIVERHIDECGPSLSIIDTMASWCEGNMAQPFMKDLDGTFEVRATTKRQGARISSSPTGGNSVEQVPQAGLFRLIERASLPLGKSACSWIFVV